VLTPQQLRDAWQKFFVGKGHTAYASASLVPANDPTLLFTGAGMNQFKDMFLGKGSHPFRRASTVQKCLRAGDIDNVGKTLRHLTFFEMLGNFSFDDYFKDEAIAWGWEFTTAVLGIPGDRVTVTIYEEDEESFSNWRRIGIPVERIRRFSAKANYWPQNAPDDGPNGPCGPCTELYYDAGPGTERGDAGPDDLDSGRYLEFWNLVFPQFDRQGKQDLRPLGRRNVDTGAGLDRTLAVLDVVSGRTKVADVFHTDLMMPIVTKAAARVNVPYVPGSPESPRIRRIADHARAAVFCIADGVKPSNEGRGYVLRRILRRAIRDGILLGVADSFVAELVPTVIAAMRDGYPDLPAGERTLRDVIRGEEEQFRATYAKGLRYFEDELSHFKTTGVVPGAIAFKLHDTYGFPIDLLTQIAEEEHRLRVDRPGFDRELEAQRTRARAATKMAGDVFDTGPLGEIKSRGGRSTDFLGYDGAGCEGEGAVVGLVVGEKFVERANAGQDVTVVLDRTPFYAEGGGQVGDRGVLASGKPGGLAKISVRDTKGSEGFSLHLGRVEEGEISVGDRVLAVVDRNARDATRRNHTATHLLHEALKRVLGSHVQQKGSLVAPDRLRFDFSHGKALAAEELSKIETLVNGWILDNAAVDTQEMATEAAKSAGAVALFGENYGDRVRVVGVPAEGTSGGPAGSWVSRELCGGTHARRAGDIGSFRITSEGAVASGVRRIEGATGTGALAAAASDRERLRELSAMLKAPPDQIATRITALQDELRDLRKLQEKAAAEAGAGAAKSLASKALAIGSLRVLVADVPGIDSKGLRPLADALFAADVHAVVLVGDADGKAPVLAAGTPVATKAGFNSGDALKAVIAVLGGKGGGRPDMAQGQGESRTRLAEALAAAEAKVRATTR
jgi:alanyl-tRNA synthetase